MKICSDISPQTLPVQRSEQFLWALRNRCPRTNFWAYFRAKWRLLCLLSFKSFSQLAQFWKFGIYVNNSRHLARKYARIFVRGHYLFREAYYIFAPNGGFCLYYPSNLFRNARSLENWGILDNYWKRLTMILWIIKIEVCVMCRSRRLRQITQTRGFDNSWYHARTEFNNCFIIHFSHNSSFRNW